MPQNDLALRARNLTRIHDAVITGDAPPEPPRALVARSWRRMLRLGIDPSGRNSRLIAAEAEVESRRRASKLRLVVNELRDALLTVPESANFILVVTDAEGVILWRDGGVSARRQADGLGFVEGATWTETVVGTNAIGTALAEETPVQLFAAEHFETTQHPWYCSAVPIHDPTTGTLLGVVDISGPALTLHPVIRSLVTTAVRLAEAHLLIARQEQLSTLRDRFSPLLHGTHGPVLVVDDDGWVAYQQGLHGRDRVETPVPGRRIHVPGAGLCLPEKVDGGWVLRPHNASEVSVSLKTDDTASFLEITSGAEPLLIPLSPRRAQILRAVTTAGQAGITAGELSRQVYGDTVHAVTVRAEVSRLRRSVGALLTTSPYRWADGVVVAH